jgi:hypothetical protein
MWPPDQVVQSTKGAVEWAKLHPRETQGIVKRLREENRTHSTDKDRPGRTHTRVKELAKEIATHAVAHKLTGTMVLDIFRQTLDENMREFYDTLKDVHGLSNRRTWYETLRNAGVAYTEIDAINELNALNTEC